MDTTEAEDYWCLNGSRRLVAAQSEEGKESGAREGAYFCLGCKGPMGFRKGHTRTPTINGIATKITVRPHFFHLAGRPATCTGESVQHLLAKQLIAEFRPQIFFQCTLCNANLPIMYSRLAGSARAEVEHGKYKLDVGLFAASGELHGAVEVFKTHRVDDEKAAYLTETGLAWAEVAAVDVITRVTDGVGEAGGAIQALRCARDLCDRCDSTEKAVCERDMRLLNHSLALSEAARRVRERRVRVDVGSMLRTMEERLQEEKHRQGRELTVDLVKDVMAAIDVVRSKRSAPPTLKQKKLVQTVLSAHPDAIRWGDSYYWLSPDQIFAKDLNYFCSVLCGHNDGKEPQPPENVRVKALVVRQRYGLCVGCHETKKTDESSTLCDPCWKKHVSCFTREFKK